MHRQFCIVQAPVILSQGDLQDKVAEVLEAVKKDQSAAGAAAAALPQIVLVSSASKSALIYICHPLSPDAEYSLLGDGPPIQQETSCCIDRGKQEQGGRAATNGHVSMNCIACSAADSRIA